jgi:hypothetical protein
MNCDGYQRPRLHERISSRSPRENFGAQNCTLKPFESSYNLELALFDPEDVQTALLANEQHILSHSRRLVTSHHQRVKAAEVASFAWRDAITRDIVKAKIETWKSIEVRLRLVGQRRIGCELLRHRAGPLMRIHGGSAISGSGVPGRVL